MFSQYWTWLTGLLHGNLGTSLAAQEPVTTLLAPKLVNSSVLVAVVSDRLDPAVDRDRVLGGVQAREGVRHAELEPPARPRGAAGVRGRGRAGAAARDDRVAGASGDEHDPAGLGAVGQPDAGWSCRS